MSDPDSIVVVGAGLAGLRVAEAAREAGFAGRIVLIGEEPHAPYDRPPLSKAVLLSDGAENEIALEPEGGFDAANIELKLGRAVREIDRAAHAVTLEGGERVLYGRLVLATGSRVRTLTALPPDMAGVHYLRGLDEALALRAALAGARRVAIVGAGVIGLEIAAAAADGREVFVIEAQQRAMMRTAPKIVSDYFEQRHRAAGVAFHFGVTVKDARAGASGVRLELSNGAAIEADVVVVGVGVLPNVELAEACGLRVEAHGVVTDGHGRTSDPDIFAAGEVALHFNERYGRYDRQETWAHAAAHGAHVGRSIVAPEGAYRDEMSYWSDQYDINLQVFGSPAGDAHVLRGDPASGKFLVFHVDGGVIAGVSAVNAARDLRHAKKLVGRRAPSDQALADGAKPLAELA